jgi:hypothetical protein
MTQGCVFSLVEPAPSKEGKGEAFILPPPPQTSRWKLASRNQNIRF